MTAIPRRIRVAARLWQFVGGLVAGLQLLKFIFNPNETSLLNLIPFLAPLVCLFFIVSGSLAVRRRWQDILIPSSIAVAAGFSALLWASAILVTRSLPVTANDWDNVLLHRPPADAYFLSIMGTLLLLAGLLALTRRREYRGR